MLTIVMYIPLILEFLVLLADKVSTDMGLE